MKGISGRLLASQAAIMSTWSCHMGCLCFRILLKICSVTFWYVISYFYHQFIHGFSVLLTSLLKNTPKKLMWLPAAEEAFT